MFTISKINALSSQNLPEASVLLDKVSAQPIACNNWQKDYPYTPDVKFRIAHNGSELFIKFSVTEACTMAKVTEDNGEVWTDSCVEFFLALDDTGYYNLELTCIGKALLGFRKERPAAVHATPEIMASIKRFPTLGTQNFDEKKGENHWELTVALPATALFRHGISSWDGLKATVNVYKCGDNLSQPHFLSWQPIDTPKPDFHVPRCFTEVEFAG